MQASASTVVIGMDTKAQSPVRIGYDALCNHMHILAGTGAGKTTLKKNIFQQVVSQGHGCLFMSPAPDAIWESIALVPQQWLGKVILIDPADAQFPYASNLLSCPNKQNTQEVNDAVNRLMHVFKKIWGPGTRDASWGPQLENVLRNCLYALVLNDLTLAELPYLLRDGGFRDAAVSGIPPSYRWTPWFWQEDFSRWQERLQMERTDSTLNKVLEFLTNSLIEHIVGQQTNTLHLKRWINEEKIILIHLSENAPGLGDEAVKLLGTMLMAQIKEAVFAREPIDKSQRKFFPCLVDEFHLFAGDDFKTLLERGRALNVPFVIGHQDMAHLETEALREAVNQTGNKVTGQVTVDDARRFAPLYTPEPEQEQIDERKTEEVSGHRAVCTLRRDVVGHLLHQGHEDERVITLVKGCLEKLRQASLKKVDYHRDDPYPKNHLGIEYDPERIPDILAELNTWLFAGMQDRSALWQSLPLGTHWYLLRFFGITRYSDQYQYEYWSGHHLWYAPVSYHALKEQEYAEKRWQEFRTNGFAEEAAYSGISRDRLFNAAIAAVEAGFVDFLTGLFPSLTPASIREAWRQSGLRIPSCTHSQMRLQALRAYKRILAAILEETARQPGLDAALYTQRFLEELSRPRNAVELFLPVLYNSYGKSTHIWKYDGQYLADDYRAWRTIGEVAAVTESPYYDSDKKRLEMVINKYKNRYNEAKYLYNLKLTPRFTYHLELLTDNIHLRIIQGMQAILPSFLSSLRFFAILHCAQLALNQPQGRIWTLDSGVYEENKHTQTHFLTTPRQNPSEVAGLMERELLNLEPLTAWCRIQDLSAPPGEKVKKHKIAIPFPTPLVTGQALTDRIRTVRKQSRLLIAPRPASVVAAEIRGRGALLRQQAAPDARAAAALPGPHVPPVPESGEQPPKRPRMGEA